MSAGVIGVDIDSCLVGCDGLILLAIFQVDAAQAHVANFGIWGEFKSLFQFNNGFSSLSGGLVYTPEREMYFRKRILQLFGSLRGAQGFLGPEAVLRVGIHLQRCIRETRIG